MRPPKVIDSFSGEYAFLGQRVTLRGDWEDIKVSVMEDVVRLKFAHHPDLRDKLLATGKAKLIEGNNWGDTFWGMVDGRGRNELGKILMRRRERLREESQ